MAAREVELDFVFHNVQLFLVISVLKLKSTPVICCSTIYIYGKISIVQLKTCPEVSVTYVLCILAQCELYSGCYQLLSPLSFEASGVGDFLLLMIPIIISDNGDVVKSKNCIV